MIGGGGTLKALAGDYIQGVTVFLMILFAVFIVRMLGNQSSLLSLGNVGCCPLLMMMAMIARIGKLYSRIDTALFVDDDDVDDGDDDDHSGAEVDINSYGGSTMMAAHVLEKALMIDD